MDTDIRQLQQLYEVTKDSIDYYKYRLALLRADMYVPPMVGDKCLLGPAKEFGKCSTWCIFTEGHETKFCEVLLHTKNNSSGEPYHPFLMQCIKHPSMGPAEVFASRSLKVIELGHP